MKLNFSFSIRGPDRVAEELATVLSRKEALEFKSLFDIVYSNLRNRDLARGGEEMLRLRAYEKLQNLVQAGVVKKDGKEYRGVPKAIAAFFATAAEFNAKFAAGKHCRPPVADVGVQKTPQVAAKPVRAKVAPASASRGASKPRAAKVVARKR